MKIQSWKVLLCAMLLFCGVAAFGAEPPRVYGPLTFNSAGADFYFAQDGKFAPAALASDGAVEIRLQNAPFQVGYNGRHANITLAQMWVAETAQCSNGFKSSRLAFNMTGASGPNSAELFVFTGRDCLDGNTVLSDEASMKAEPMPGFQRAHQINELFFMASGKPVALDKVKGTLYGWILVHKRPRPTTGDIMQIRLIFEGPSRQ